jgi:hypothetical protein
MEALGCLIWCLILIDLAQWAQKVCYSTVLKVIDIPLINYLKLEIRDVNQLTHVHWEVSEASEQPDYQGEAVEPHECAVL